MFLGTFKYTPDIYALTAYLRAGYLDRLRSSFIVNRLASRSLRAFRMARVFFGLKSKGLYFLPLYNLRRFSFVFWFMTMYTRAIALRTTRLKWNQKLLLQSIE